MRICFGEEYLIRLERALVPPVREADKSAF